MSLCRNVCLKLGPLARWSALPRATNVVPLRPMSSAVPGSSGGTFVYVAIVGVSLSAGVLYAYRTLSTDQSRFKERITEIGTRPKDDWKPKPWPPADNSSESEPTEAEEAAETSEEPAEEESPVVEVAEAAQAAEPVEETVVEAESQPVLEAKAAVEAALAEAMEEPSTETAPAMEEGNVLIPDLLDVDKMVAAAATEMVEVSTASVEEVPLAAGEAPEKTATETSEDSKECLVKASDQVATQEESNVKAELVETHGSVAEEKPVVTQEMPVVTEEAPAEEVTPEDKTEIMITPEAIVETEALVSVEEESTGTIKMKESAASIQEESAVVKTTDVPTATVEKIEMVTATEEPTTTVEKEQEVITATEESILNVEETAVITATEEVIPSAMSVTSVEEPATVDTEEPEVTTATEEPAAEIKEELINATAAVEPTATVEKHVAFTATEEAAGAPAEEPKAASATKDTAVSVEEKVVVNMDELAVTSVDITVVGPETDTLKTVQMEASETLGDILVKVQEVGGEASSVVVTKVPLTMNRERSSAVEHEPTVDGPLNMTVDTAPEALQDASNLTESDVMETPTAEPKPPMREYLVVVLEGVPKVPKTPKVLAIAPVKGSIKPPVDHLHASALGKQEASAENVNDLAAAGSDE